MCSGSEVGSYLGLINSCITQLKARGPARTCNESREEEEEVCGQNYAVLMVKKCSDGQKCLDGQKLPLRAAGQRESCEIYSSV